MNNNNNNNNLNNNNLFSHQTSPQLIPFLMAGYPNQNHCEKFALALIDEGALILEIGVPFSDPLADGVSIQKASEHVLSQGYQLTDAFELILRIKTQRPQVSIILFTYLNPINKYGLEKYVETAIRSGITGTLVVDLPVEEADHFLALHQRADLKTVFLAAPTTSTDRLHRIAAASTGFIYFVARTGVTGAQSEVSISLPTEIQRVRKVTSQKIAIGFGISSPAQFHDVGKLADAVVVGSHLIDLISKSQDPTTAEQNLRTFAKLCLATKNKT
jgi:tryptophan synthase alpha chain